MSAVPVNRGSQCFTHVVLVVRHICQYYGAELPFQIQIGIAQTLVCLLYAIRGTFQYRLSRFTGDYSDRVRLLKSPRLDLTKGSGIPPHAGLIIRPCGHDITPLDLLCRLWTVSQEKAVERSVLEQHRRL